MKRQHKKIYLSPVLLLAVMAASIYAIEFLVMIILIFLPHESHVVHALLDSTLLILLLSPVLYLFLFRPLLAHIKERNKMEAELLKAQKLESLGILAGGIAHDYNNLLSVIMANLSLAIQIEDSEDRVYKERTERVALDSLKDAEKATLRAKDLTRQLITFAKGGAPVKEFIPDITRLIKDSADFALRGSNVRSEFSIPGDLWPVKADSTQLVQVLQNIIINAVQAMPDGGVVTVTAENMTIGPIDLPPLKPGSYLKISIKDRGTGIPEEDLGRVFDPYFTTKEMGSGLGLAISYSIVKNHWGHISVDSETGVGSTFSVYLPTSTKKEVGKEEDQAPVAEVKDGHGRILIMDDEELIRDIVSRTLREAGYEVESAQNGNEAIDIYLQAQLSERPFDVVILDLTIPGGLGGKDAIKELFELDPEARAIVSSGYSDDPIMEDFEKYGFKGAVAKPYNTEELKRVVEKVILMKKREPA